MCCLWDLVLSRVVWRCVAAGARALANVCEDVLGQRHVAPRLCLVSCANGRPGGFCVSEKDCGDGSDEKTCPEPAGQCIEAHAPSP